MSWLLPLCVWGCSSAFLAPRVYLPDCVTLVFVEDEGGVVPEPYRRIQAEVHGTASCIEAWLDKCYGRGTEMAPYWQSQERPEGWPRVRPDVVWSALVPGESGDSTVQFESYGVDYYLTVNITEDVACPRETSGKLQAW